MEVEVHPHQPFVPENACVLILGSFPGRKNVKPVTEEWFYSAPRNQFWKILSCVFDRELATVQQKKELFTEKRLAIADLFLKVSRKNKSNSDSDLIIVENNYHALANILQSHSFKRILFTSKFVGKEFHKLFPGISNSTSLPSPSPRFALMSFEEKVNKYKELLL